MKVLSLLLFVALLTKSTLGASVTLKLQNVAADTPMDGPFTTIGPFAGPNAVIDVAATPRVRFIAVVKNVLFLRLGVSVIYKLDGKPYSFNNFPPFDTSRTWNATLGPHNFTATVHRRNNGRGRVLASVTVPFTVVNRSATSPSAPKAMAPTLVAPATMPVVAGPPTPVAPVAGPPVAPAPIIPVATGPTAPAAVPAPVVAPFRAPVVAPVVPAPVVAAPMAAPSAPVTVPVVAPVPAPAAAAPKAPSAPAPVAPAPAAPSAPVAAPSA